MRSAAGAQSTWAPAEHLAALKVVAMKTFSLKLMLALCRKLEALARQRSVSKSFLENGPTTRPFARGGGARRSC